MEKFTREVETEPEKDARIANEKTMDRIIQDSSPKPKASLASKLIAPVVITLLLAGFWVGFRVFEKIGYDEVAVIDCGEDAELVALLGSKFEYVGFCDVSVYIDSFSSYEDVRVTFTDGKIGDIGYHIEINVSDTKEGALAFHRWHSLGNNGSYKAVVKKDIRNEIVRLAKTECEEEYCFSTGLREKFSARYFERGMKLSISQISIYIP